MTVAGSSDGPSMTTDTSERGLEALIVRSLIDEGGYIAGDPGNYDREHAVDTAQLFAFLNATQPEAVATLGIGADGPPRLRFLHRLAGEIDRHGVVDVLRKGVRHGPAAVELLYGAPTPGNTKAERLFAANVFGVTRQLRYSKDETRRALDLALFVNGLPVATFELKNRLTGQTVEDAVAQYRRDRDPKEPLFRFGRCVVHFAVDDREVRMCTHLRGKDSWFLPFDKGWNDGAGNPPNPHGLGTDYLWKEVLARKSLTDVLENYAQIVTEAGAPGAPGAKKTRKQIFPRFHQLDAVRRLLADAAAAGAGRRYLIQHSAGSGKSNSIAWLAHRLIGLETGGAPTFDSVVVVTDRRVLDKQIRDTIRQFAQVSSVVGHAERSGALRGFLESGKKIVITTVQKFPFVLDEIGDEHRGRRFAIVIDEAHSSQGGRATATMHMALGESASAAAEDDVEDALNRLIEARRMLSNASYFAFTATPKNKTLEIFGTPAPGGGIQPRAGTRCGIGEAAMGDAARRIGTARIGPHLSTGLPERAQDLGKQRHGLIFRPAASPVERLSRHRTGATGEAPAPLLVLLAQASQRRIVGYGVTGLAHREAVGIPEDVGAVATHAVTDVRHHSLLCSQ